MKFLIFIPSKNRLASSTALLLMKAKLNFFLVVEPQEANIYRRTYGRHRIMVLPKDDQGLAYVRNFIHAFNTKGWYWMLDDDITGFYVSDGKKCARTSPEIVLGGAEMILTAGHHNNIGQGALEYQQFSWSAKERFTTNSYCDVAVAIDGKKTKDLRYRDEVNLKEDRDFTLQVLNAGMISMRLRRLAFSAPKNGSNKGGLYDVYRSGRELRVSRRMIALWGKNICKMNIKKGGRPDIKINWKAAYKEPKLG